MRRRAKQAVINERREMFREARNLGFRDEPPHQRETKGSPSVVFMRAERGDRFLSIQFWGDGKHRVSHGTIHGPHRESEITRPTDFVDLAGMYRAIAFEWQRPSG